MAARTPFYEIRVEGEDISAWVSSVTVVEDDRQADNVTVAVADPHMAYADGLIEGSEIEVDMGYADAGEHALLLRAIVTKVETSYPESGVPVATLKGEDRSIEMGLEEKRKVWRDRTVTDIVRAVAKPYPFARVEAQLTPDPKIERKPIHQDGKSDLAFLQELAERYHARCFVELDANGKEVLWFLPERRLVQLRRPDKLTLSYRVGPRSNLIRFAPSFDSSYIDRLKAIADVDAKGQPIESRDKPPPEAELWQLDEVRLAHAGEADRKTVKALYAKGAARKQAFQAKLASRRPAVGEVARDQEDIDATSDVLEGRRLGMTATGTTFGNVRLRAKSLLEVTGVSARFDGEWYVTNVTHKIDPGGHVTDFKCVR